MHRSCEDREYQGYDEHRGRKRLFWGVALIAAGSLFLLDNFGIADLHEVGDLWPAVFVVFGLGHIIGARRFEHVVKGIFEIGFGFWLYACITNLWGWTFGTTWPIILIAFGVKAVATGMVRPHKNPGKESAQ